MQSIYCDYESSLFEYIWVHCLCFMPRASYRRNDPCNLHVYHSCLRVPISPEIHKGPVWVRLYCLGLSSVWFYPTGCARPRALYWFYDPKWRTNLSKRSALSLGGISSRDMGFRIKWNSIFFDHSLNFCVYTIGEINPEISDCYTLFIQDIWDFFNEAFRLFRILQMNVEAHGTSHLFNVHIIDK